MGGAEGRDKKLRADVWRPGHTGGIKKYGSWLKSRKSTTAGLLWSKDDTCTVSDETQCHLGISSHRIDCLQS